MVRRTSGRFVALANVAVFSVLAGAAACISTTDNSGPAPDITGAWSYTGTQAAPSADLTGVVTIAAQDGELIGGSATWEESSSGGMVRLIGGQLSGRVIGTADVDFDVLLSDGTRRHVARLTADTMRGSWVQAPGGLTGQFTAVREMP